MLSSDNLAADQVFVYGSGLHTKRSHRGYEKLHNEHSTDVSTSKLIKVAANLLVKLFRSSTKKHIQEVTTVAHHQAKQNTKLSKIHPLFNILDPQRSKKAMAKPEFLRYLEYMKEAGTWDPDSDGPVLYFK
ncbi:PREDICTED: uncharacterized protein LOC104595648 [Nelumbo nucifera]|uniref:Uncharacterized protein LOC104595648 n=2 Tax=Nelumbo nucifera TaxID=4432 RepID=A0A1U7ZN97_NELNU|nr:PREDICTED: uncharacterized protein LOC104595648 [Nelumbo nucifera]DAD40770.1 TPA_asm: hypothetical protein HUJ06_015093 [Nelumbo nucifera]